MTARAKNNDSEENERPRALLIRFGKRLQSLKKAQEYSQADNIPNAVKYYNEYLDTLAKYHGVDEKKLRPTLFDEKKDLAEMLLISHVYWDLSKAFDRSPKLVNECERCLRQFVHFSTGKKFQYLNSEMLRKFMKRGIAYNPKLFEKAYKDIRVNSKKCYIATYCYGEAHPNLRLLRKLKSRLSKSLWGDRFVEFYYRFSPPLVYYMESHPKTGVIFSKYLMRPLLNFFSIILSKMLP